MNAFFRWLRRWSLRAPIRNQLKSVGITASVGITMLLVICIGGLVREWPESLPTAACLRIFQLSSSQLNGWESAPGTCHSASLSRAGATCCLHRRAARLARPAHLVLVGDSRARGLQEQLQTFLRLDNGSEPLDVPPAEARRDDFYQLEMESTRGMCRRAGKFCSRRVVGDTLLVDFWWRPFARTLFVEKLREVLAQCGRGACPDIVVLNSAVWYCRDVSITRASNRSAMFWMLVMRDNLRELATVLRALVRRTVVVWRLDEHISTDIIRTNPKANYQKRITASHAFVYDLRTMVDGLVVWSSMLPETVDFTQRVCAPLKNVLDTEDPIIEEIFDECDDEIHVGYTLGQRFVSMLLNTLCEKDGHREPAHCCRASPVRPLLSHLMSETSQ